MCLSTTRTTATEKTKWARTSHRWGIVRSRSLFPVLRPPPFLHSFLSSPLLLPFDLPPPSLVARCSPPPFVVNVPLIRRLFVVFLCRRRSSPFVVGRSIIAIRSFVVLPSPFAIRRRRRRRSPIADRHRSSFVVRRSSFVVRRSSFVVRRSSFVVRRSSFVVRLSFVRSSFVRSSLTVSFRSLIHSECTE